VPVTTIRFSASLAGLTAKKFDAMMQKDAHTPFTEGRRGAMILAPSTRRPTLEGHATNFAEKCFNEGVDGH
jgi:hypothetical protein